MVLLLSVLLWLIVKCDPTNNTTKVLTKTCHYIILATCFVQGTEDRLINPIHVANASKRENNLCFYWQLTFFSSIKFYSANLKENYYLGDLEMDVSRSRQWILKKQCELKNT